eukprot:5799254-Prymnesium_polylepis.1
MKDGSSMSAEYIGNDLSAEFGDYGIETLQRAELRGDYFTTYSRVRKSSPIVGDSVHLGWIKFKMVGTGDCVVKSKVNAFRGYSSGIPGVIVGDQVPIFRNRLELK